MTIPEEVKKLLLQTTTLGWLAVAKENKACDFCRTCGVQLIDEKHLKILFMPSLAKTMLEDIKMQQVISFNLVNAYTFESYQFKGEYSGQSKLNTDEEKLKKYYLDGLNTMLVDMSFNFGNRFQQFANLDGIAVTMRVNEIYDQTPKKGSGNIILNNVNES